MKKIIYYVAVSLDGYIAGPHQDVSQFAHEGRMVERYIADLAAFSTVIMGSKTYEFGYQFGLPPGYPAYPDMEHFVFLQRKLFDDVHPQVHLLHPEAEALARIKSSASTDIYLCGGGTFAAWVAQQKQLDEVRLKVNPIVLGSGTSLFQTLPEGIRFDRKEMLDFGNGYGIHTFDVRYS